MIGGIAVDTFRELYSRTDEFAVIDPREELFFARAHLFAATNMPLSHLEAMIGAAVPLKDTTIVLCDDNDGLAERAAEVLAGLGYSDLRVLTGGLPMWAHAGGAVYPELNVPSKAVGEFVEKQLGTPTISAKTLHEITAAGEEIFLLDARPLDEHIDHCIPGSICCPAAELIYRTSDLQINEGTRVVIHCAGRTRGIIGAQTLIDAGTLPNAVWLMDGTSAWRFAGLKQEIGDMRTLPKPGTEAHKVARKVAERLCSEWQIPTLKLEEFDCWRNAPDTRYAFDIRTEEEYLAGHLAGSRHIAGGQLIQTTESHLVVQNAYVLLIDDDGVRAVTTAVWLRRMGWKNVSVCEMKPGMPKLQTDHFPAPVFDDLAVVGIDEAEGALQSGVATLCDIRSSVAYRQGHIPGAGFLTRAQIEQDADQLPSGRTIILMADDQTYAELISRDLKRLGHTVCLLDADLSAWTAAGHPLEIGITRFFSRPSDTYLQAADFDDRTIIDRLSHVYARWAPTLTDITAGEPAMRFDIR